MQIALLAPITLAAVCLLLPSREASPTTLRADYVTMLKAYGHARYVWGGESPLGIDCSGLVRKGMVWGQIINGIRTFNGGPIRDGVWLWWTDFTAKALQDGYRNLAVPLFKSESVNKADQNSLAEGDLAVTSDGIHVMVYIGDRTWMEADPDLKRVVQQTVPAQNRWFRVPVTLMRWQVLREKETRTSPDAPHGSRDFDRSASIKGKVTSENIINPGTS